MLRLTNLLASAAVVSVALARTDLVGCTSTDVSSPAGASIAWYVPGTGELCDFLDCGGGRAPPKTNVPGCPLYSGTATYSPSYLPGYGAAAATSAPSAASSTPTGPITTPAVVSPATTATPSAVETTTSPVSESLSSSSDAVASSTELTTASSASSTVESASVSSPAVTSSPSSFSAQTVIGASTVHSSGPASAGFTTSLGRNSTSPSGSQPTVAPFTGAAAEVSRVWFGSAGLIALGAFVAAL